ncbi:MULTISPECIES: DUF929 family protein [Acidianus]|uniref:DUF929 domain-containing protein n=1 Tax=Candidatus Acidianus copahuensis TaxID=1160895 RepID=A0A031LJC3_9CREN|nr:MULTISPECIES: DUF929 family protein [Acidianus]EZQ02239.1 hypothetical protein CM19_10550 [Candidatus Acidianus copahuensis]NON61152.1 DUF929 family protein [Acidianus sp. RZ1]
MIKRYKKVLLSFLIVVVVIVSSFIILTYSSNNSLIGIDVSNSINIRFSSISSEGYNYFNQSYIKAVHYIGNNTAFYEGKPVIIFIGAEWCPYCNAESWALLIALERFGNITGLQYMESSSSDIFPNTHGFSFTNVNYSSKYISFLEYEYQDRNYQPLQPVPQNIYKLWMNLTHGSIPFIYIAGHFYQAGSNIYPGILAGKNWTYIISQISNKSSPIAKAIYTSANILTAMICQADGNHPSYVCDQELIQHIEQDLLQLPLQPLLYLSSNEDFWVTQKA